jgi:hypothetical protein
MEEQAADVVGDAAVLGTVFSLSFLPDPAEEVRQVRQGVERTVPGEGKEPQEGVAFPHGLFDHAMGDEEMGPFQPGGNVPVVGVDDPGKKEKRASGVSVEKGEVGEIEQPFPRVPGDGQGVSGGALRERAVSREEGDLEEGLRRFRVRPAPREVPGLLQVGPGPADMSR